MRSPSKEIGDVVVLLLFRDVDFDAADGARVVEDQRHDVSDEACRDDVLQA